MLQTAFPSQPLSIEANDLYLSELQVMERDFGALVLDKALIRCIRECRFMPTVAEIREHAEQVIEQQIDEKRRHEADRQVEEIQELHRRRAAGETFYSLHDVFTQYAATRPERAEALLKKFPGKTIEDLI